MGILEFHFHESEFSFEPHVTSGGGEPAESEDAIESRVPLAGESESASARGADTRTDAGTDAGTGGSAGAGATKRGLGVLLGLAFLVGLDALGKKLASRRRGREGEPDQLGTEKMAEESVEIAD